MFGKSWQTRWDDAVDYLNTAVPVRRLGAHIESVVTSNELRKSISKQLSLGTRADDDDDPAYGTNTTQRLALRALLLCQRVYFGGDTWAGVSEAFGANPAVVRDDNALRADWKLHSLNHWRNKTTAEILQGIRMFDIVDGANQDDVAEAAQSRPNDESLPGNLILSRTTAATVGKGIICYVGVQGWLVRSGVVSMRWFMQCSSPNGKQGCDLLFGTGREVWDGPITAKDEDRMAAVCQDAGRGAVIHIWSPANTNWNGHWVIANGDGTVCGVNNGEIPSRGIRKDYTRTSTLYEQFRGYSNHWVDAERKIDRWTTAKMAVIDPMQIPNRI